MLFLSLLFSNVVFADNIDLSLEGYIGTFGFWNVNHEPALSSYGDYTAGGTPAIDFYVNKTWRIGTECMLLWGQPKTDDNPRFIINPNVRFRMNFPYQEKMNIGIIISGGLSIWPEMEGTPYLNSSFLEQRTGWNIRTAASFEYEINDRFSITGQIGYSASSSINQSNDTWITHDTALFGIAPRITF